MIMRKGQQQLLLPANPLFIWATLGAALLLDLLPIGRAIWAPDPLLLLLVFWSVHQPSRVGMGAAFVLGLCMDVHQASLLGQHALCYTVLVYLGLRLQRRLLWLGVPAQTVLLLPVFFSAQVIELLVRMISGGVFPGWGFVLAPVLEALLWPLASMVLLAPQRRAPDPDENRPL
ncbi:rod shape-determining protein MreD [Xylophilus sp. ASV27]|uniref:rod shape-determining protein MreD n=1 Tax=Xylophilus sp. ASV27 TaxID=2795129 RepID=UPI0018EC2A80|nr:rod shape-determining protein MreD [Xylophilus sp. ASV27]